MLRDRKESQLHYKTKNVIYKLSKDLFSKLHGRKEQILVLCIGTDRSTGDSLGPFVGTLLKKNHRLKFLKVYGTLHSPVHAKNLKETIRKLNKKYPNCFLIAIDASLGRFKSIGNIIFGEGSIQPGLALNKDLPEVGHYHITGIVNVSSLMNSFVLQNTRLSLVMSMAERIAYSLKLVDYKLSLQEQARHN